MVLDSHFDKAALWSKVVGSRQERYSIDDSPLGRALAWLTRDSAP